MDQFRRSNLLAEQFILTELDVAETFITTAEATSSEATRNRCKANARKLLDKLYLYGAVRTVSPQAPPAPAAWRLELR